MGLKGTRVYGCLGGMGSTSYFYFPTLHYHSRFPWTDVGCWWMLLCLLPLMPPKLCSELFRTDCRLDLASFGNLLLTYRKRSNYLLLRCLWYSVLILKLRLQSMYSTGVIRIDLLHSSTFVVPLISLSRSCYL